MEQCHPIAVSQVSFPAKARAPSNRPPTYPLCPSVSPFTPCVLFLCPLVFLMSSPCVSPQCPPIPLALLPPPLLFSDVPFSSVPPSYVPELLIIMFEIQCLCSGSRINTFILTEGENVEMELKTLGLKMFYKF